MCIWFLWMCTVLTLLASWISKSCIKLKTNLISKLLCGTIKGFIEAPQSVKIKSQVIFFCLSRIEMERVKFQLLIKLYSQIFCFFYIFYLKNSKNFRHSESIIQKKLPDRDILCFFSLQNPMRIKSNLSRRCKIESLLLNGHVVGNKAKGQISKWVLQEH